MKLYTIGSGQRSAQDFFEHLQKAGVRRIIDIRLHNTSQLAGFSKMSDLPFFLKAIGKIDYLHLLDFSPTEEIMVEYKKKKGSWEDYEKAFKPLIKERKIEKVAKKTLRDGDCLLCMEHEPDRCHRRLVAEYLQKKMDNLEVIHL